MAFNTFRERLTQLLGRVRINEWLRIEGGAVGRSLPALHIKLSRNNPDLALANTVLIEVDNAVLVTGVSSVFTVKSGGVNSTALTSQGVLKTNGIRVGVSAPDNTEPSDPSFRYISGSDYKAFIKDTRHYVSSDVQFGWSNSSASCASADTILLRDAANTLAQRNSTNAQTSRLYGTYTDASNYRRLTSTMSTAGVAELKPEGVGTGASGNVLHISGLPTSNPGPGILWNDGGTVKVGT